MIQKSTLFVITEMHIFYIFYLQQIIKSLSRMMKKYFQIGKEFLSKKLEQLDSTTVKVDYVSQQIPNRLKEPLSVLQQEEIDIEDAHAYQNYFKNYPNHHLSHFLLDKYNMMVEGEAEVAKYILPGGKQCHIPPLDQNLQHKALLFRQAIQEYDEGFSKNDEPIICVSVINFHHKRGTEIQYRYPQNQAVQSLENLILHHAMPDSSHHKHQDYNFFNFQAQYKGKKRMLFGVSYFKQIKLTQQMKKNNSDLTRSYLQKAVAVLSTLPLFGYLKVKLSITTKVFFEKFTNFEIIQQAYKQINKHLLQSWPNMPITDLYIGSDLKSIIPLFQVNQFYQIWKAILYQRRVVVFGHSSSSVSSFVLSLLSLFPGLSAFGIFSKPIAKYMQSLRQLALPLRLFSSQNLLCLSFHIQDFNQLNKFKKSTKGNFFLGTTNRLLKQSNDFGIQMLVNLQNCSIERRAARRPWQAPSKKERKFLAELQQIVKREKGLEYGSSQDCIRNHFHTFLKAALTQIIAGIKAFENFKIECRQFALQSSQQIDKGNQKGKFFPPLMPQQTKKMIFTELLLQKSFAYFRQFKNQKFPQIVKQQIIPSLYINNYDYLLRLSKQEFISYNWIDKKLSFGTGQNPKNFEGKQIRFKGIKDQQGNQQTKSIYVGKIQNGKFEKSGCYLDQFERYQGQYNHGMKEGYGKLVSGNQKYIGDFVHDAFQGNGQLIIGNDIYAGQFKNGLKHGYGAMQGSFKFEGIWDNNYPTVSSEQIRAKQQQAKMIEIQRLQKLEQQKGQSIKKQQVSQQIKKQSNKKQEINSELPKQASQNVSPKSQVIQEKQLQQQKQEQSTKQKQSGPKQEQILQKDDSPAQKAEDQEEQNKNYQTQVNGQKKQEKFESMSNSQEQEQKQKQHD